MKPYRHDFADLDKFIRELDAKRNAESHKVIQAWLPVIAKVRERLALYPEVFSYQLVTCDRMKAYLIRHCFMPDSYIKMLSLFREFIREQKGH